jgi:nucleotide-binding universal stress UspA family protein
MLAQTLGTSIDAVTAYHYEPVTLGAAALPTPGNAIRFDAARRTVAHAVAALPSAVTVSTEVAPADRIADALLDRAAQVDATLVVLGPDQRGHVTEQVLHRAACPVAVAPADPLLVAERLERIAVAFDGSPTSRVAIIAAADLALAADASLTLLCVAHREADADRLEHEAAGVLAQLGHQDAGYELLDGPPVPALRAAAERFDLLACGSRGRGRITSAILGSTSAGLVGDAPCPVLVTGPGLRRDGRRPLGVGVPPTLPL